MLDITTAKYVEIEIRDDGTVVWVHINGITQPRICQIDMPITITDHREGTA